MEFIINNSSKAHPMALHHFEQVKEAEMKERIEILIQHYRNKKDYFIQKLAEASTKIATAKLKDNRIVNKKYSTQYLISLVYQ